MEERPWARADRLESLIAVLAVVAVRLRSTKLPTRGRPETFAAAASFGPARRGILEQKLGLPKDGWTNRSVLIATARLRGFRARKEKTAWPVGKPSGAADNV